MKQKQLIQLTAGLLVLLAVLLSILVYTVIGFVSAEEQTKDYSYTKAICDDKTCQDYVIVCNGTKLVSKTEITGASMAIPNDWTDPRPQELIDGFCNLS